MKSFLLRDNEGMGILREVMASFLVQQAWVYEKSTFMMDAFQRLLSVYALCCTVLYDPTQYNDAHIVTEAYILRRSTSIIVWLMSPCPAVICFGTTSLSESSIQYSTHMLPPPSDISQGLSHLTSDADPRRIRFDSIRLDLYK